MKKYILCLSIIVVTVCSNIQLSAQTCPEVQDKSILLQGSVNGPCAIYTARDFITLKPGFTLSGGTKIVQFNWGTGSGGSTPQIKIGSSPYCFGIALPVNFNMSDLMNSITALKNSLISTLGSGYIIHMSLCGTSCAWITVENLSDFSYTGVYTSVSVLTPFQLPNTSFIAKIDNSLLFPVSYLSSNDIPDPTTRQPNTNLPFGSTAGAFNVSPTGAATYEIPITVPTGLGGLEPKVSITYNSQSGNGLLGWGCNLTGLSSITRVPKNLYSDNTVSGLKYNADDRFALDGNRLVLENEGDIYGASNTTYRTENETFMHIISHDTYSTNCPVWFEVFDKNGTKYKYGSQGGSCIYTANGNSTVLIWYLDYVEDKFGNTINYTYVSDQNGLVTYLKAITYGTNKSGVGTTSTIDFFYEQREDPIFIHYNYINAQIDRILYKVVTRTGNQILRIYDLAYTKDAFSRLTKVTESNGSGEPLNPTYLKWGDYKSIVINQSSYTLPIDIYYSQVDFSHRKWTTGDVNGDGLTELISFFPYMQGSGLKTNQVQTFLPSIASDGTLSFTTGTPYNYLDNIVWDNFYSYSTTPCIQNLNGDNEPDIVVPALIKNWYSTGRKIKFYALNHSTVNPVIENSLINNTEVLPIYDIGDLNNDGISDIVYVERDQVNSTNLISIHYSTSNPNWSNTPDTTFTTTGAYLDGHPAMYVFIGDYNADGLNDVMVVSDQGGYEILRNTDGAITASGYGFGDFSSNTMGIMRTGDFNGDGLQDFVMNERDLPNWYYAINKGDFTFNRIALPLITTYGQGFTDKDNTVDNCLVNDFNNDGKSDIIIFDGNYDKHCDLFSCWGTFNNFKSYWYKSTGNNVTLEKVATSSNDSDTPYSRYMLGDFNGDGRGDLMNFGYDCYNGTDLTQKWRMYATPNTNYDGGMVTSISNGLGQNTSIAYSTTAVKTNYSVDASLPSGNPAYPLSYLGNSAYVVKSVATPNGVSSSIVQTYAYANGIVDLQRGFMGFGKFTVANPLINAFTEQNYEFKLISGTSTYNTYYQPFLTSITSKVGSTVVSETSIPLSDYSVTPISGSHRHVFMYPTKTIQTDYLKQTLTTTTTTMDSDGNVLTTNTGTADKNTPANVVASQITTYNGYDKRDALIVNPNPFKNAPDNVVTEQTHKDTPGNTFTITTAFNYNTNGTLLSKTDFSGTSKARVTSFTYDVVGNLLTTTAGDRSTTLEYTADKRFVSKKYDAINHFVETAYDCWGNPLVQWDMNRLQTAYQYDDWGRLTSVTAPDGAKTISSVNWFDKGNATSYKRDNTLYYTSSFDEDNHFISAEYFDAARHSLRKAEGGFNGRVSFSDVTYNSKGQVYTVSDPYPSGGTPTKFTTNSKYDPYGRLTVQTLPNLVTVTTAYSDDNLRKVTSTYSTGEIYSKEYDAAGLLTKATDPGGSITYAYFSNGKPKNIQPAGGAGATAITYNPETGLQETLNDPSSGANSYSYNIFGELETQTDGNSKTTTMVYDKLGRVKTKTIGSLVTTYNYDDTGAIGLAKNITTTVNAVTDNSMSYKYDALCRVTEETRSKGTETYAFKYEYDTKSRVSKLTYPNDMALTYGYNSLSDDLTAIYKDGTAIWSLGNTNADVNEQGQIAKVTLGNGKATLYGYDTQNRLSSIVVDNILNFGYVYNDKQQLVSRNEKMHNGTTMAGFIETFTYDGVNRLLAATKDNGNTPLTMTYKAGVNDRIETKSDAATFNYTDISKYKVTTISDLKSLFPPHNLTYNDEGKTTQITETNAGIINKTLILEYGLDRQRFKTEYTQDGSRKYTRYYFDTYEKEVMADGTTRHLNYIYAGNTLIAIFEQKTSGDKMHYVYTDYLGSLRCITSATGAIEQRLSYDAWGSRRDYQTGKKLTDAQLADAIALTSRGYTGQEHIDGLGLINLNARMYEPALGIFLSPDNYVQAPDNSQNFNRYTYCVNNPLMYSDKSGNVFGFGDAMIILAEMYLGGFSANSTVKNSWNPVNWNWSSPSTYIGIGTGARTGLIQLGLICTPFPKIDGMITRGVFQAGVNVGLNGIANTILGDPFFENWEGAARSGYLNGASTGYRMAELGGENLWWGSKIGYNRNKWSLNNGDVGDYRIEFLIPNEGSNSENDCVPTTFIEIETRRGGKRTYKMFTSISNYQKDIGVLMSKEEYGKLVKATFNNVESLSSSDIQKLFDPKYMQNAANNNEVFSFQFYRNGSAHADNVRSLEVFTRAPELNRLRFRNSSFDFNINSRGMTFLNIFRFF